MRISDWAKQFGIWVEEAQGQPGEIVYRVKDIFTTRDGSWEPSDAPGSVPQWARDAYLKPYGHPQYFDDAGAATNLFGAIMGDSGALLPRGTVEFWTYADNANHSKQRAKISGWANISMFPSSSYVPDRREKGPWAWQPKGVNADTVKGGGLPQRWHVSMFAVWEAVKVPVVVVPPVDPPVLPTGPDADRLTAIEAELRRLSLNVDALWKRLDAMEGDG